MVNESRFGYLINRIWGIFYPPVEILPTSDDILFEKDVVVPMRDKAMLSANVFRPKSDGKYPVIISFHPYDKDVLPKKGIFGYSPLVPYRILRQPKSIKMSPFTGWEAPDPCFWVKNGYVIINADCRGFGKSKGKKNFFSDNEAEDYYDLIEWAAKQSWSNGKVGLSGVSYLAISQYKVAALQPPHLKAICPWEGFSNLYKDLCRPGGIREDGFMVMWSKITKVKLREETYNKPLMDAWYDAFNADLTKITVPALVCATFSDHCLHSRGSFRVFYEISSKHKWLYTHRGGKWATYYSDEALSFQLKFFDYFLKDASNDLLSTPPVRLEVRETGDTIAGVHYNTQWPLSNTHWQKLYLDASTKTLNEEQSSSNINLSFNNQQGWTEVTWKIPRDLTIAGPMKLTIFVELQKCKDVNIFVAIDKIKNGERVVFEGSYGFGLDCVAKGFLKASLRNIDKEKSLPGQPDYTFDKIELLEAGQIVPLEISLLPSATLFRKDEVLKVTIQGHYLFKPSKLYSQIGDYEASGPGHTIIHCSNKYPSYLLLPIITQEL